MNMYKGPRDKAKGGRIAGGRWGWVEWEESSIGKTVTTVLEQQ